MHRSTQLLILMVLATHTAPVAAQIVRFETSLGPFSIELFPDKAPLNVANFLNYVNGGRYDNTVINRAVGSGNDKFVVQMGNFSSPTTTPPALPDDFVPIPKFDPVQGEPAQDRGLSNVRGTVGLAIAFNNIDSGTSSFFVNGTNNSFLDLQGFTVFGEVRRMATIDRIFEAPKLNLDPGGFNLAVTDIPLQDNGELVFILSAVVVPEPGSLILLGTGLIWFCFGSRRQS